jgi:hypothetical protein
VDCAQFLRHGDGVDHEAEAADKWREAVGQHVEHRRRGLFRSARAAAAAADVSESLWRQVESGRRSVGSNAFVAARPGATTRMAICRALRWTDDSLDRLEAGDDPIESITAPMSPAAVAEVAFSAPAEVVTALRENTERLDRLTAALEAIVGSGRLNPTEPPPGTVPARTDAQRAAEDQG